MGRKTARGDNHRVVSPLKDRSFSYSEVTSPQQLLSAYQPINKLLWFKYRNCSCRKIFLISSNYKVHIFSLSREVLHSIFEISKTRVDAAIQCYCIYRCSRSNLHELGKLIQDIHLLVISSKYKTCRCIRHSGDIYLNNPPVCQGHQLQGWNRKRLTLPHDIYHHIDIKKNLFHLYFCIK